MNAQSLIPILNVSDLQESFAWFEKLGWRKLWDWDDPPNFGAVRSGACEIFLCEKCQGSRGRRPLPPLNGFDDERPESGAWMSIFVEDVDAIHRHCIEHGIEITLEPTDLPWGVRELHVRHPDGHVFRIGRGVDEGQ